MPHTLLLADDSVTIQRVIELTFADEDVTVVAVGDGNAAVARLDGEPVDIVLADVDMPGRDGFAVARHVRDTPSLAHVPVLLLTGAFDPVDDGQLHECGASGVLVKPFEPQLVISRVRELLRSSSTPKPRTDPSPTGRIPVATAAAESAAASAAVAAARPAGSVDDYFQRLDEAFATLNVPMEPAVRAAAAHLHGGGDVPDSAAPEPAPPMLDPDKTVELPAVRVAPPVPEPPAAVAVSSSPAAPISMADAFGAVLGMEQGDPAPLLPEPPLAVSDELVDEIVRRVTAALAEPVLREIAPAIVAQVAERIVRDEIDRLKTAVFRRD